MNDYAIFWLCILMIGQFGEKCSHISSLPKYEFFEKCYNFLANYACVLFSVYIISKYHGQKEKIKKCTVSVLIFLVFWIIVNVPRVYPSSACQTRVQYYKEKEGTYLVRHPMVIFACLSRLTLQAESFTFYGIQKSSFFVE